MEEAPYRLCCGQQHWTIQCPDGLVMCDSCFNRVPKEKLVFDPVDQKYWDICLDCKESVFGDE